MAQTKIKAGLFEGIIGNGTDGYFLMSNGDGTMTWSSIVINPTIASIAYPGSVTAADPAGGETITVTGTGFKTGATVTISGTAAPAVSYVSATQITFTTPAKAAGDYDIVVTNTDTGSATFINGISYNGIPTWTTAAGSLGTFASDTTISTITLQATEPDAGTITFSITNGALPTGLSLTGANIDGTTTLETADTLYTFTVTATDDESQATPRTFTITVTKQFIGTENFTINTYTGNGSTQSIEGKIGTAADFNGSSSYIDIPSFSFGSNNITVSMWVNPSATQVSYSNIFDFDHSSGTEGSFTIQQDSANTNQYKIWQWNGSAYNETNTVSLTANQWNHLAFSLQSTGSYVIYVNGSSTVSGSNLTASTSGAIETLNIGRWLSSGTPGRYFNGSIDQVRIFNKALSSSEVTTLYGESNTSTTKSTTDIFDDGSGVALYEFEKGAKDTGGVNGYIGAAGIFNGSSSNINTTYTPTVANLRTVSLWFKTNATAFGVINSVSAYGVSNNYAWQWIYMLADGKVGAGYGANNGGAVFIKTTTASYNDNSWHHLVLTLNGVYGAGSSVELYIDGVQVATTTDTANSGATSAITGTFRLGHNINAGVPANIFNGSIDQVRIFDKAISSSEVTTLYGETSASATKSTTDIFDDGSGVALYELEGNALDTGKGAIDSGQSAVFNGSSSRINLSSNPINGLTSVSFSFWLKPADISSYQYVLSFINSVDGWNGVGVRVSNTGKINIVRANNGAITTSENSTTTLQLNVWQHIVVTVSQSSTVIYLDGSEDGTFSSTPFTTNNTGSFDIGMNEYSPGVTQAYTQGSIDQVRIYSSALSASDVEALVSETNVPTANLVAHYKLDCNANDETGSYNGTATSITYSDPAEFPTYDGTATNVSYAYDGTPTNVSFVGTSFQPDFVWIKARDNGSNNHLWTDSIRGVGVTSSVIGSNLSVVTNYNFGHISAFDSNGFTVAQGSSSGNYVNSSSATYVAWCWKAGGSVTPNNNTDGSDTTSVSANQDAGFSIVSLSKTDTNTRTYGHGLSSSPEMIILKRTASADDWLVYHKDLGNTVRISLNSSAAKVTGTGVWGSTTPTDSVFTLQNQNGGAHIAYCFHSVDGYQKVGSYTGNGSSGGQTITGLGFNPRFLLVKNATGSAGWRITDSVRGDNIYLYPNLANAEDGASGYISLITDGFRLNGLDSNSSDTYIYLAIA